VFPVRCELNSYVLRKRNLVLAGVSIHLDTINKQCGNHIYHLL
jgi:hypothetical protein